MWIRTFLAEIGYPRDGPTILKMDNQSAIALSHKAAAHARTKHIDVRHHYLREKVEAGEIETEYVPTGEQVADVLTKGLAREKHEKFTSAMGIRRTA